MLGPTLLILIHPTTLPPLHRAFLALLLLPHKARHSAFPCPMVLYLSSLFARHTTPSPTGHSYRTFCPHTLHGTYHHIVDADANLFVLAGTTMALLFTKVAVCQRWKPNGAAIEESTIEIKEHYYRNDFESHWPFIPEVAESTPHL